VSDKWSEVSPMYPKSVVLVLIFAVMLASATVSTPLARAQTLTLLHTFVPLPDGEFPSAMIQDAAGNFYGTAVAGGSECESFGGCGTVFKVAKNGKYSTLYSFAGGNDGARPLAALILDAAGNLYGTTQGNGYISAASTVFKLDPSGTETVLHIFNQSTGGGNSDAPLVLDKQGNLYGTTPIDGDTNCGRNDIGCGVVFKVDTKGNFNVIHTFSGPDGEQPEGGLVIDAAGNLYGSTWWGGHLNCKSDAPFGCGAIFKLDASGKFTTLYRFKGVADGRTPLGVTQDSAGNLYGIATEGGDLSCNAPYGCGTIFEVDARGKFKVLYTFSPTTTRTPVYASTLLRDKNGNLYGAKQFDGAHNAGFLFRLSPSGKFTDLVDFPDGGGPDGSDPIGFALSGKNFYISMDSGGDYDKCPLVGQFGCGTLLKVAP